MLMFLEEAISDVFKLFLVGMVLYSVLFLVLLRASFYRTRSFARRNLRNLRKLKQFMEDQKTVAKEEKAMEGHELLNNIMARYRPRI